MMPEVDVPPPHHAPHAGTRDWVDFVVPFCALAISVMSLILAMIHGRAMERMADANARLVKASSWPFLEYQTGNVENGRQDIELRVANVGVGPARVKGMELFWHGQPVADHNQLLTRCCGARNGALYHMLVDQLPNRVLPAREKVSFITLPHDAVNEPVWQRLNQERMNLSVRVCYCSVFDECWIADLSVSKPPVQRPVEQCPVPAVPYTH